MRVQPLTPSIGAEILDVDLSTDLAEEETFEAVRAAFVEHHVLVFRNQQLNPEQHKAFGRRFGSLHIHPSQRGRTAAGIDPEIFAVRADAETTLNNGGLWHSDVSCDEIPPLGSMLLLDESPPVGGDTLFANMHLAFESLSAPIRYMLTELNAVHDQRRDLANYGYEPRPGVEYPRSEHPVVVAHPETGRPLLFVNSAFTTRISELTPSESDAVLTMLFNHIATRPDHQCRVQWEPGTLVFWDNRSVQHYAVWDYRPAVRRGSRVTIAGTERPARPAGPA